MDKINRYNISDIIIICLLLSVPLINIISEKIILVLIIYCLVFIMLIIGKIRQNGSVNIDRTLIVLTIFAMCSLIPYILYDSPYFWGNFLPIIITIFIWFVGLNFNKFHFDPTKYFITYSLLLSCMVIYKFFSILNTEHESIHYKFFMQIPLGASNYIGFFLLMVIFIILFARVKTLPKLILLTTIVFSIVAIQSRSTIVGLALAVIVLLLTKEFKKCCIIVVLMIVSTFIFNNIYEDRSTALTKGYYGEIIEKQYELLNENKEVKEKKVKNIDEGNTLKNSDSSFIVNVRSSTIYQKLDALSSGRITIFDASIHMFLEKPIFGVGLGNIKIKTEFFNGSTKAHNLFIDLLAATGIVGFLLYTYVIFNVIKLLWINRKVNNYLKGLFYAVIAAIGQSMLEPNILELNGAIMFWTCIIVGTIFIRKNAT